MENGQKLGIRVLILYLCNNLMIGFGLLVASIILSSFQDTLVTKIILPSSIGSVGSIINFLIEASFVAGLFALLVGAEISWLMYADCAFCLGEDSFNIKRGILSKTEISIPYRQIQDVYLNQTLLHRLLGVSKIVILTAGNDNRDKDGEAEGIFEIIDRDVAENLKRALIEKSSIQKVIGVTK